MSAVARTRVRGRDRPSLRVTVVAVVLLVSGCAADDPARTRAPVLDAVASEVWRAGGFEEHGGLLVAGVPRDAVMGPGGRRVVLYGGAAAVLGPDGAVLHTFGQGDGPGELRAPRRAGFHGDSLWITDPEQARVTWFDDRWNVLETEPIPPRQPVRGTPWNARGEWMLEEGGVLGVASRPARASAASNRSPPYPVVMWDAEGDLRLVDSIASPAPRTLVIPMGPGRSGYASQPIDASPIVGATPAGDGFFALDRTPGDGAVDSITVRRYDATGRALGRIDIPYRPQPVSDSVRTILERWSEVWAARSPADPGAVLENMWVPDRLPPVQAALADEEGLWLEREMPSGVWERYDRTGRLRVRVEIPGGFEGLAASSDRLVGYRVDSLSVPYFVEFRVSATADPSGSGSAEQRDPGDGR